MSRHRLKTGRDPRAKFLPEVEALEGRELPAVNISVSGNAVYVSAFTPHGQTVKNEQIQILDNGSAAVGNVSILVNGALFRPNFAVGTVVVNMLDGNDRVDYLLTGPLTTYRSIVAALGAGNDHFTGTLRGAQTGGALDLVVFGQRGDDQLTGFATSNFTGQSNINWTTVGGQGNDMLGFQQSSNIHQNAFENVFQSGGNGQDKITASYGGRLQGALTIVGDGGGSEDKVSTVIIVAANSTGMLANSAVLGGAADDNLTFLIPNQGSAFVFNQIIDGGSGFNTCTRTTNVLAFRCQRDRFA